MKRIYSALILSSFLVGGISPFALAAALPQVPTVTAVTTTGATVAVPQTVLSGMNAGERAGLYFEYIPTEQVCIMIYPTPAECLPKKTTPGQTTMILSDLKPGTKYNVWFKKDNTIACITTPCPENGIESSTTTFTTLATADTFTRNLAYRSRGNDVVLLQDTLRARGYFAGPSTGYFGVLTLRAVKAYQKEAMGIPPTGFVGPLTRASLNASLLVTAETFEGVIQSVSTACFADGECSVTIGGKKVVTTIGWSQAIVGSIKGTVSSIGDIETSKIGARAKVYAQKTVDGYTLYGNANYYIEVQ